MWLLDTCVVSELSRAKPDASVAEWLGQNYDDAYLSAVSLGELVYGIERMPTGARRNALARWCSDLQTQFADRVLVSDEPVWQTYGRLKASLETIGKPQDDMDILIGATATIHHLQIVTRNVRHFKDMGLPLFNPWPSS